MQDVLVAAGEACANAVTVRHDQAGTAVTVDCTGVTYLDSAGVAVLFDRAGAHDLRLVAPPLLDRVLRVSGLPQVAEVVIG